MAKILAIIPDLIFSTKVFSTARALQVEIVGARTAEVIAQRLEAEPIELVIVDLNAETLDPIAAIRQIKGHAKAPKVLAFLSHVQVELGQQAREAGADQVMARSGFVVALPGIVAGYAGAG
jgi:DNA-binding NarL/FixJ family response regulator